MAIIERPGSQLELAPAGVVTTSETLGVFRRPTKTTGWKSWLFTIDHKKIGVMYGVAAFVFFIIGGIEALLIRLQLAQPNGKVLSAGLYNEMFTTHATTMIFFFVMPMVAALANYLVPLQIGARDVAFPRMNAFGFWCFLSAGIFLYLAPFLGGLPDGGWFAYRTMFVEAGDTSGIRQTTANDFRVTPIGKFLRAKSIDELPQLINVLFGDMSIVGPRPHVEGMLAGGVSYEELVPYYRLRHTMRPGLSGWAQANGLRGPTTDGAIAKARIDHDLAYIQNFSVMLDLEIILLTIKREFFTGTGV